LEKKLQHIGLQAHLALGAFDISRVDIRLDINENPQLLEINPLPGLTPGYSDICIQAAAEGIQYEDLILEILYLAAGRWGLLEPHGQTDQLTVRKLIASARDPR
jgi:D-alanine-D-alanine ligase